MDSEYEEMASQRRGEPTQVEYFYASADADADADADVNAMS